MNRTFTSPRGQKHLVPKMLPLVFIVTLAAMLFSAADVLAQKNGMSDWHVPPPSTAAVKHTKTHPNTKQKPVVQPITDVPAVPQPAVSPVHLPQLEPISTTSPQVNAPQQPMIASAGIQDIPLPLAPDAPGMPQRTLQDMAVQTTEDVPVPPSPDMPDAPAEPVPGLQQPTSKTTLPVLPALIEPGPVTIPANGEILMWGTPGIPEDNGLKFTGPTVPGDNRQGNKGSRKSKTHKN